MKLLLSKTNIKKRFAYANEYVNKNIDFWEQVIFTYESKFNIFGSDGRKNVWRKEGEALNPRNITHTIKHGGGNVMVWGSMSANGVENLVFVEGKMNKTDYLNILKNNFVQSAEKMGLENGFVFVQDNDPKHSAALVKEWLLYNTKKVLPHPPQSPDLNPIEHLWAHMKTKLKDYHISGKETLKNALMDIWNSIPADVTRNLVHSMPRRLQAVKDSKGHHTKY